MNNFRSLCHSQRSPQAFSCDDIFATDFPPMVLDGVTSHRFASGGKEAWKRVLIKEEMMFTFTVIQVSPGTDVQLVEWRPFTMFYYVQTINEENFWRYTGRHISVFNFLKMAIFRQLPDFNALMQIFQFSLILYSLSRLLAFPNFTHLILWYEIVSKTIN